MILISACLVGIPCRYDGVAKPHPRFVQMLGEGNVLPICPEQLGGLKTPRLPAEIVGDKVVNKAGEDVTKQFEHGAECVLSICQALKIDTAILKANSPSCGCGKRYDGTFSGTLIDGNGKTAQLLKENGVKVFTEETYLK